MTPLVPIVYFGWIPLTIYFFNKKGAVKGTLLSLIGGILFIPIFSYDFPLITYNKNAVISLSILISFLITNSTRKYPLRFNGVDFFVLMSCVVGPIITSLSNGLGLYDAIFQSLNTTLSWGFFFWMGRRLITNRETLEILKYYILIGTLIYVPLCLVELRFSPQLNRWVYGFYAHSFLQHIRNGGYRPMVFMQHGLMVTLWLASGAIIAFSYWVEGIYKKIWRIPIPVVFFLIFFTTLFSNSTGSTILMFLGIILYILYRVRRITWPIRIILLFIPLYFYLRLNGIINSNDILQIVSMHFNAERTQSVWFRFYQEDLYTKNMIGHQLFGWGGWNRSAPIDPRTGYLLIVRDSMWLGLYSQYGFVGMISVYLFLLYGPFKIISKKSRKIVKDAIPIVLILTIFSLDSLLNSMVNVVYLFCAGALITYFDYHLPSKIVSNFRASAL